MSECGISIINVCTSINTVYRPSYRVSPIEQCNAVLYFFKMSLMWLIK